MPVFFEKEFARTVAERLKQLYTNELDPIKKELAKDKLLKHLLDFSELGDARFVTYLGESYDCSLGYGTPRDNTQVINRN